MATKEHRDYIIISLRLIGILLLFTAFVLSIMAKELIWGFSLASALIFEIKKLILLPKSATE